MPDPVTTRNFANFEEYKTELSKKSVAEFEAIRNLSIDGKNFHVAWKKNKTVLLVRNYSGFFERLLDAIGRFLSIYSSHEHLSFALSAFYESAKIRESWRVNEAVSESRMKFRKPMLRGVIARALIKYLHLENPTGREILTCAKKIRICTFACGGVCIPQSYQNLIEETRSLWMPYIMCSPEVIDKKIRTLLDTNALGGLLGMNMARGIHNSTAVVVPDPPVSQFQSVNELKRELSRVGLDDLNSYEFEFNGSSYFITIDHNTQTPNLIWLNGEKPFDNPPQHTTERLSRAVSCATDLAYQRVRFPPSPERIRMRQENAMAHATNLIYKFLLAHPDRSHQRHSHAHRSPSSELRPSIEVTADLLVRDVKKLLSEGGLEEDSNELIKKLINDAVQKVFVLEQLSLDDDVSYRKSTEQLQSAMLRNIAPPDFE